MQKLLMSLFFQEVFKTIEIADNFQAENQDKEQQMDYNENKCSDNRGRNGLFCHQEHAIY